MILLRVDSINLAYGNRAIFVDASLAIESGEKICIVGRNGAGKSTLLKLLTRKSEPDSGEVIHANNLQVATLEQDLPAQLGTNVREVIRGGLSHLYELHHRNQQLALDPLTNAAELQAIGAKLDSLSGWQPEVHIDTVISQLALPANKTLGQLSGGWRRRVMLGRALVAQPDLLLLDEPTNHLDISTIEWLEASIQNYHGTVVFITHDRELANNLATRVVEIDRGQLTSWQGSFVNFLRRKLAADGVEDRNNALFDKRLAIEEDWMRQGIKARRTRNEGRVRSLTAMREVLAARVKRPSQPRITILSGDPSGRKVIEARNITHQYGKEKLIDGFSLTLGRGERIGVVGNNGVGKSTLLKILIGQITPDTGSIKISESVRIGHFDQINRALDPTKSVLENINEGRDYIQIGDKQKHVVGYLRNYLFDYSRVNIPVDAMSGGERNRALLARLFSREYNLLVLDEPTNDLDVELLEVLEQALVNYQGTLLIVSHDRMFLDNVVDRVLVFEQDEICNYVGNYSYWLTHEKQLRTAEEHTAKKEITLPTKKPPAADTRVKQAKPRYREKLELEQLPKQISYMETQLVQLNKEITKPNFFDQKHEYTNGVLQQIADIEDKLNKATERWYYLENRVSG